MIYCDFQHLNTGCLHLSHDMTHKTSPAPYYIWIHFLILSGKVSSDASTLKQNIMCLSLPWDQTVDMEMNVYRNKYFTDWYWLVTINMKSCLDIVPPIKVFVTYLTYPTLVIHYFYPSLQCLHNPISYWYLTILDASSHIFQKYHHP